MHYSPQVALLEAVLGSMLFLFFLHHSWRYDRLDSLKIWRFSGSRDVFKKVMTFCYLLALPTLGAAGAIMAWIKYQMGFTPASVGGFPVPFFFWPKHLQAFIDPISIVETLVWFFDLVVHHQELTFWFWLVRATPSSPPWFQSFWFKFFLAGTAGFAALFLTLLKLFLHDELVLERNVDISYSSLVIAESLAFANIFYVFPNFIKNAKAQGGTNEVLGRLLSFHELNKIRIAARLTFGVCLFALGIDAFTETQKLNKNPVTVDALLFISVISNVVSAMLTLMVFMPRAILREHGLETTRAPPVAAQGASMVTESVGTPLPIIVEGDTAHADGADFNIAPPPVPESGTGPQIVGRPSAAIARPGARAPHRPHRAQQSEDFDVAEPFEFTSDAGDDDWYRRNRTQSDVGSTKEMLEMRERGRDGRDHVVKVPTLNRLRANELERRGLRLNPGVAYYRSPIDMTQSQTHFRAPSHPSDHV